MIKYILVTLLVGAVAGYLNGSFGNVLNGVWVSDYLFNVSLILLLFVMGFAFGLDREAVNRFRRVGPKILIVPLAVASGSLLSGIVSGLILGRDLVASVAVCAGYGWYTLAGPMIGQAFGAEWGALGFAANFLRELLTIVTISILVKIDKYAPIAAGGATTSDTTLPVIIRYCGNEALITAFTSGFVLSIVAPFTIVAVVALAH